jgi:anaerobic selenocysteine-containing dehydrogenase
VAFNSGRSTTAERPSSAAGEQAQASSISIKVRVACMACTRDCGLRVV